MKPSKRDAVLDQIEKDRALKDNTQDFDKTEMMVIIRLKKSLFALKGESVKEILPYEWITQVPGTPDMVMGIINVRGQMESIADVHSTLGLGCPVSSHSSRILICVGNRIRSGILVDEVRDVNAFPVDSIKPPFTETDESTISYYNGELEVKENILIPILDIDVLFKKMTE